MNLETKIIIYKFTPQVFTLTQKIPQALFGACGIFLLYGSCCYSFCNENPSIIPS